MNITAVETPYFYRENDELLQAAEVDIDGIGGHSRLEITAEAGGTSRTTVHEYSPANRRFTVLLPPGAKEAVIRAKAADEQAETGIKAGGFRPWTLYIAQDKHLDYGWKHTIEDVMTRINRLTDYYIDANAENGTRFNLDCTLWLEEYERSRPAHRFNKLASLLRTGAFQMGALKSTMFNGILAEDELIHALSAARRYEREYGIPADTAMPNEIPSVNWGMAQVLAGSGVKYVVRGAYDLNNSNLKNRYPIPLFWWEGPDGSRVLMKHDLYVDTQSFGGYAEAWKLSKGFSYEERKEYVAQAVRRYEAYDCYPFDAILLAGTGWDEYPFTHEVGRFISWYNSRGWAYPRLVDATWRDYFSHIEKEPDKLASLPVLRGDFGSAWEEWPSQLAYQNALFRNARRMAAAARTVSAMAALMTGGADRNRADRIRDAFSNLCHFAHHNIGGITEFHGYDTRDRKTQYAYNATKLSHEALEASMSEIAEGMSCDAGCHLVFNTLSWNRSGALEFPLMEETAWPGTYRVIDTVTGRQVPWEVCRRNIHIENYMTIQADDVPAFGCKVFRVEKLSDERALKDLLPGSSFVLENGRFRLKVDEMTGGLSSLLVKENGRELADGRSPYTVNQYQYTSESEQYAVNGVKITGRQSGPVSSSITVEGRTLRSYMRTTYTLYEYMDYIDIENYLEKQPSSELQTCHFIFPFAVPGRQYHYDGAAAILRPGEQAKGEGDQLAGAAMGTYCGLHFADASGGEYGVTLCSRDTHLYHFGSNTMGMAEGYIDPDNATIYSVALENYNENDNCSSQGNQDVFVFRYRIVPHAGGFNPCRELMAGLDAFHPFVSFAMGRAKKAQSDSPALSLITVDGAGIVASGAKTADDGNGLILRLRNTGPDTSSASVWLNGRLFTALSVDHLEREGDELPVENGVLGVDVPPYGLVSVKLMTTNPGQ